jgi:hypothetical protein
MNSILGYFVFINMGDGCLGSKYGNTGNLQLLTESGTRIGPQFGDDAFIGEYVVTWLDTINPVEHTQARLSITRKSGTLGGQYSLQWSRERDPSVIFV